MDNGFADIHFIRQLPFGGQSVAGFQLTGKDELFNLRKEQFFDGQGIDGFEFHLHGLSRNFLFCFLN